MTSPTAGPPPTSSPRQWSSLRTALVGFVSALAVAAFSILAGPVIWDWYKCDFSDNCRAELLIEPLGDPIFIPQGGLWAVDLRVENTGDIATQDCILTEATTTRSFSLTPGQDRVMDVWLFADPPEEPRGLADPEPEAGYVKLDIKCANINDIADRLYIGQTDL